MISSKTSSTARGFTLVELLITVLVLAILLSVGIPSFNDMLQRTRLKSAAGALYDDLHFARVSAIGRGARTFVVFSTGTNWCWGLSDSNAACDCNTANSCTVAGQQKVVRSTEFNSVALTDLSVNGGVSYFAFDPRRGSPEDTGGTLRSGSVAFVNPNADEIQIDINVLGRISQCSDQIAGYSAC